MNPIIARHFRGKDFDIRKKYPGYSRFMDQKVTPDVISFIADCILNLPSTKKFTVRDIWESSYFEKNTKAIFGKPAPSNKTAFSEYNKFIGQPLKTLAYAQVLNENKKNRINQYSIGNKKLLEYISLNERGSLDFLYEYITKILNDSSFYARFENYKNQVRKRSDSVYFDELKRQFRHFMLGNTEINGDKEINRIFPKIINPLAVKENIPGSEKGYMTKHPFTFSDLMYNRVNFRDIKKAKGISRQEATTEQSQKKQKEDFAEYHISKATELIRRKYSSSELKDQWARGQATQVHHIFPRPKYPEFAAYPENLIKLTPEQHFSHAHPNARTQEINPNYQIQCLIAKCDSIDRSTRAGEFIYSIERMTDMLRSCFKLKVKSRAAIDEVKRNLIALQTKAKV